MEGTIGDIDSNVMVMMANCGLFSDSTPSFQGDIERFSRGSPRQSIFFGK